MFPKLVQLAIHLFLSEYLHSTSVPRWSKIPYLHIICSRCTKTLHLVFSLQELRRNSQAFYGTANTYKIRLYIDEQAKPFVRLFIIELNKRNFFQILCLYILIAIQIKFIRTHAKYFCKNTIQKFTFCTVVFPYGFFASETLFPIKLCFRHQMQKKNMEKLWRAPSVWLFESSRRFFIFHSGSVVCTRC